MCHERGLFTSRFSTSWYLLKQIPCTFTCSGELEKKGKKKGKRYRSPARSHALRRKCFLSMLLRDRLCFRQTTLSDIRLLLNALSNESFPIFARHRIYFILRVRAYVYTHLPDKFRFTRFFFVRLVMSFFMIGEKSNGRYGGNWRWLSHGFYFSC